MIDSQNDFRLTDDDINKIVVIKLKKGQLWAKEREKYLYKGSGTITDQNQRQVRDNEIIIEFDHNDNWPVDSDNYINARRDSEKYICLLEQELQKKKVNYIVTDHGGKSPH
jgi:hypothetical protein